jgi:DNA-directed RNA polymerase specialized sigma24 family protein
VVVVTMTKLTKSQQAAVVNLFRLGTSIADIAMSYGVPADKIEQIIRKAMPGQVEAFKS